MWEVFSDGEYPYGDVGQDDAVARRVREGELRLKRPSSCPSDVWELMAACWQSEKERRPQFGEMKLRLQQIRVQAMLAGTPTLLENSKKAGAINVVVIGDSGKVS